jgi:hypothetical protein
MSMKGVETSVTGFAIMGVIFGLLVPSAKRNAEVELATGPPPISEAGQRAWWTSDSTWIYQSQGAIGRRECREVTIRLFMSVNGAIVAMPGRVEASEMLPEGAVGSEFRVSSQGGDTEYGPTTIKFSLPTGAAHDEIDWIGSDQIVSTDRPCEDGYSGQRQATRLFIRSAPPARPETPISPRSRPRSAG